MTTTETPDIWSWPYPSIDAVVTPGTRGESPKWGIRDQVRFEYADVHANLRRWREKEFVGFDWGNGPVNDEDRQRLMDKYDSGRESREEAAKLLSRWTCKP